MSLLAAGLSAAEPRNFGIVVNHGIYRGAQPAGLDEYEYLSRLGVKTILKLNSHKLGVEKDTASKLGMKVVNVALDPATVGSADSCGDVARALKVLTDRSNWPVYVHCTRGRDRTGFLIGAYRARVQHWAWADIDRELARYGHKGGVRRAYPLIASELEAGVPTCSTQLESMRHTRSAP